MSWRPSSRHEAWERLERAAPPPWVMHHTLAVEGLAHAMAERAAAAGLDVDQVLIEAGALLHDIGRSEVQDATHAYRGARLLEAAGTDPNLVRLIERHTGAGLPAADAVALGLPRQDFVPTSLEERIVAHADNLFSGTKRLFLADIEAKYEAKGLRDAWRRIEALHHDLCGVLGTDLERLAPTDLAHP